MFDTLFEVLYIIGWVAGLVIRAWEVRRNKPNRSPDGRKPQLEWPLMLLIFVGMQAIPLVYVLTPWLDWADYHLPALIGWLGVPTFAAALWLLWRSHTDLGRNWSSGVEIMEGHSLVTQGVYRYIRHPMYAAHWLWAVAQALLLQNWIAGLAFLASYMPFYLVRVPREEQLMAEHFGEEYRLYVSRTGRVIPRLWK